MLGFLRLRSNEPITLYLDNAATVLMAGAPIKKFSQASKHFDIEEKWITQCVSDGILRVRHMPGSIEDGGKGFAADAMTKPLPKHVLDVYAVQLQESGRG